MTLPNQAGYTTPGITTYTNADGSAINSGGAAGTLATPDPSTLHKPTSFTIPQIVHSELAAGRELAGVKALAATNPVVALTPASFTPPTAVKEK